MGNDNPNGRAEPMAMRGFSNFISSSEPEQLVWADALPPDGARKLAKECIQDAKRLWDKGIRDDWRYISLIVLARLLEIADPRQYLEAAQSTDDRLLVSSSRLAAIRAARDLHEFESRDDAEARHQAADDEAEALNNWAAALVQPYLNMCSGKQRRHVNTRTPAELERLLSAVHRCIEGLGAKPGLVDLEQVIQSARRLWKKGA